VEVLEVVVIEAVVAIVEVVVAAAVVFVEIKLYSCYY